MSNPHKTPKFLKLKGRWDNKLAKSGLVDIEDQSSPNEFLKRWDSLWFKSRMGPAEFKAKERYYQNTVWFLGVHKFLPGLDKKLWTLHSQGFELLEIAKKCKCTRAKVYSSLKRLRGLMNGLEIRDVEPGDMNFIYATWLRGLYYGGSSFYRDIKKEVFFKKYENIIKHLLLKEGLKAKIACLKEDTDVILGYAVYEPQTALHYVFVKEAWRRQGLAKMLVPGDLKTVTHLTELGDGLRKKQGMEFDPWLI